MNGRHQIWAVAGVFIILGAVGILAAVATFLFGGVPSLANAGISLVYIVAAYYFLTGSIIARHFLAFMSFVGALAGILMGALLASDGVVATGALMILAGIAMAFCFYALQFSQPLKSEFGRRAAASRAGKDEAAQRYYDELEGKTGNEK